ncbi:hypothetical protein [Flavobacterium alkalisoli]|uniref:hypothetical protein n=1 Tax=Flavobacterium alkalisoli TaxID=2602769 RepID=UPI003A92166F
MKTKLFQQNPIEAMQFDGTNFKDITKWGCKVILYKPNDHLVIMHGEVDKVVKKGAYIIKSSNGWFHPVRKDVFESNYKPVVLT